MAVKRITRVKKVQGNTKGYIGLQRVTRGYRGFQEFTKFKGGLQESTDG